MRRLGIRGRRWRRLLHRPPAAARRQPCSSLPGRMSTDDPSDSNTGVTALGKVPFLAELQRDELEAIAGVGETVRFDAGQPIVQKGDQGDAMYVLLSGTAQVEVGGRYHDIKPGDFFGEMGVI